LRRRKNKRKKEGKEKEMKERIIQKEVVNGIKRKTEKKERNKWDIRKRKI